MTTPRVGRNLLATSLIVSVLTACGGGGGGGSSPTPPPPSGSTPTPTPPAPPPSPAPPANTPVPAPGAGVTSGDTYGVTSTGRLVTFDRADPSLDTAIAITGMQSGETVLGIDIRAGGSTPGQLYALGSTGRVYTVDTTSGVATQKSQLAADSSDTSDPFTALSGTEYGVDFDDATDRLRVVSDSGQNLRIDVDSGATTTDVALSRTGVVGAAYTNAFAAACRSSAYFIDATTDELLTTSNASDGALSVVGPLGVDASAVGDFEIATSTDGSNTGYAVLVVGGAPTSYSIDLGTGVAATAGPVKRLDDGELLRDTAIAPPASATQSAGSVYALTESNKLLSFEPGNPGKVCTSATFSGQAADEKIVGIDVRPADQTLWALGSGGHLYGADVSGALTLKATLNPGGDASAPYTGLTGSAFGFDFNPGNDLLRVTTDTGQNFRVALATGNVTTDTDLTPVGNVVAEAAYSNNFAGVNLASFYVIDAASDELRVVGRGTGNTINGDVTTVYPLGLGDVQGMAGFDIFGTDNHGLAALNIAGSTSSDLYTITLAGAPAGTNAAARIGTVGGGERISGLAYARTPIATVFALTTDNHLVGFKPLTPGTIDSDVVISGLAGGENVVGIDFRPADGQLYALTDQGRLYVVNTTTGTVSGSITLAANSADLLAPIFSGLQGTHFGMDFGSADDTLRIQSDAGQNLRVNPMDGSVSADLALNDAGTPVQIVSTAMTNPYAGATTSVQYGIDVAGNRLLRQTSQNGNQEVRGALTGGPFEPTAGFDVAGGENGLTLAALMPAGATTSALYRVNLANGQLSSLGAIGAGVAVRDIAIRLQ
jgi:hypothetical protein